MKGVRQRFWFTTHYPPVPDGRDILHIYVQDEYRDEFDDLAAGDRVLVYELKSGPSLRRAGTVVPRQDGKMGIICEAEILTALKPCPRTLGTEELADGTSRTWSWIAETGHRSHGYLPLKQVNAIMGFGKGNCFRGFNRGRGIKELNADLFKRLSDAFSGR